MRHPRQQLPLSLPINEALDAFSGAIYEAFGKLSDLESGDSYNIKSLFIIGREGRELATNRTQIMAFLRDLPSAGLQATEPDLFGLGTNRVRVEFGYVDINIGGAW